MTEIKLTKRYPHSRAEDITDAFMRGYKQGKHEVLQKFSGMILDIMTTADRKTEPTVSKMEQVEGEACIYCKHNGINHAYDYACDKCTNMDKFAVEDEPQTEEWYTYQDEQEYRDRWEAEPQTDCAWK